MLALSYPLGLQRFVIAALKLLQMENEWDRLGVEEPGGMAGDGL